VKIKRIDNLYLIFYMVLLWVSGVAAFCITKSYYTIMFLSSVAVFCFLFMDICDRICEAITKNNGYSRRMDVDLCKILWCLTGDKED